MYRPFHFLRAKSLLGLDIHADEVRLLQLKRIKNEVVIEKTAVTLLPPGAIVDGKIKLFSVVKEAIQELVQMTQTSGYPAAIALPTHGVISKEIQLPAFFQDDECETEVSSRLSHYLPGIGETLCYDFVIQDKQIHKAVLLVAVRSEQIRMYVDAVAQAGLKVKIVDVVSFALLRAVNFFLPGVLDQSMTAVLEIGATHALCIIYQNKQIIFNQNFLIVQDAMQFCDMIKRALQLCFSSQEKITQILLSGMDEIFLSKMQQSLQSQVCPQVTTLNSHSGRMLTCFGLALRGVIA